MQQPTASSKRSPAGSATRGIAGQCINWGALGESGHVSRSAQIQGYLDSSGWIAMDDAMALDHLARALDIDLPCVTIAAADWQRLATAHPALARSSRLTRLLAPDATSRTSSRGLHTLEGPALDAAALELVRAQAARVLRARIEDIAATQTLAAAGIDSLSSFELHNRLEQEAGVELPMARYAKARRIDELASCCRAGHRGPRSCSRKSAAVTATSQAASSGFGTRDRHPTNRCIRRSSKALPQIRDPIVADGSVGTRRPCARVQRGQQRLQRRPQFVSAPILGRPAGLQPGRHECRDVGLRARQLDQPTDPPDILAQEMLAEIAVLDVELAGEVVQQSHGIPDSYR